MATGFYWVSYKTLIELKVKWLSEQFQVSNRFCSISQYVSWFSDINKKSTYQCNDLGDIVFYVC